VVHSAPKNIYLNEYLSYHFNFVIIQYHRFLLWMLPFEETQHFLSSCYSCAWANAVRFSCSDILTCRVWPGWWSVAEPWVASDLRWYWSSSPHLQKSGDIVDSFLVVSDASYRRLVIELEDTQIMLEICHLALANMKLPVPWQSIITYLRLSMHACLPVFPVVLQGLDLIRRYIDRSTKDYYVRRVTMILIHRPDDHWRWWRQS